MPSLNKVFLMGNLTREPELRYTPSNAAICEFGIAVNRRFVQNGQDREDPCFVDIIVWEKQADSCARFLHKGSSVFIEGRLQYDQWTDKEQKRRSRLRVTAERVQFLDRRDSSGVPADGQADQSQPQGGSYSAPQQGGYSAPRRQTPRDDYGSQEPTFQRQAPYQQRQPYQPQQGSQLPPQMPADDAPQAPAAPAPARQAPPAANQPPVPPVPQEDVPPIEDDIPF